MPLSLASVSLDANNIINGTIVFPRLRQLKLDKTWIFGNVMPLTSESQESIGIGVCLMWCRPASLIAPLDSLGQDDQDDFLDHVTSLPMASSMEPLHFLCKDNWNEVQHDIFAHIKLLVLASVLHDLDNMIKNIIAILRSRQSKWRSIWLFNQVDLALCIYGTVNGTIPFPISRWLKWGATWLFWLCDTIDASISIIWCRQWHCIP